MKFQFIVLLASIILIFPGVEASADTTKTHSKNFRDDFMGQSKRPEWRIDKEDKDRYAFIDNEYLLLLTKKPTQNIFWYEGSNLPENFEAVLKITVAPKLNGQGVVFELSQDNKNALQLFMFVDAHYWNIHFIKLLRNDSSKYVEKFTIPGSTLLTLKIRKIGIEYTGFYSVNNGAWNEVGVHVLMNLKGKLNFHVYNYLDNAPESGVRIDYIEIKELN